MEFTDREAATVLAALRLWQEQMGRAFAMPTRFAEHFADHAPLDGAEIDELCEAINGEPRLAEPMFAKTRRTCCDWHASGGEGAACRNDLLR